MRVCVVGAGLAGSLLAWRLAADRTVRVDLVGSPGADATAVSGGVVRGFETLPEQRELAMDSLDELLASPVLRDWSGYRETGSTYLPVNLPADQLETAVKEIEAVCPGSAELTVAPDGWSGLAAGAVAVTERTAGRISPAALRAAVLADRRTGSHCVPASRPASAPAAATAMSTTSWYSPPEPGRPACSDPARRCGPS